MQTLKAPDVRPGAARKRSRFYAAPCDDNNGRTWDVLDRQRFTDSDAFVVEQCLPTRTAARVAASRWNADAACQIQHPSRVVLMKITSDTHADHSLTQAHLDFILAKFGDRQAFFLETVELPAELPPLPCGLHGPLMGDAPVPDSETTSVVRGNRPGPSRTCDRPARRVRTMTVIGGLDASGAMILYTVYGGPAAPREPWDPGLDEEQRLESKQFWSEHALTR